MNILAGGLLFLWAIGNLFFAQTHKFHPQNGWDYWKANISFLMEFAVGVFLFVLMATGGF